ncbi:MAG: hypothetical protein RLO01_14970 [Thalassobaculaceae bacterium]
MNRVIADIFIVVNLVLFVVLLMAILFFGFIFSNAILDSGKNAITILSMISLPLVGVLIAVLVCGLAAVLGEIMKSLREIEQSASKTEANSHELKRRFSKSMNGPIKKAK